MPDQTRLVANQMMKGLHSGRYAPGSTPESRERFLQEHLDLIREIVHRSPRTSAAVYAVLCKAALKYGKEKIFELTDALKNGTFNGADDPAHVLWMKIMRTRGRDIDTTHMYRMTVTAVRAYCEGKTINTSYLRPAESDIQ